MNSIAMVSPSFYPMIGGVENYVQGMGTELVKLGVGVDVYTPDRVLGKRCGPPEESIAGIRVHRIAVPFEASYRIKVWPGLSDALRKGGHDLIHVYSHDSYAFYALVAARKMKVPFVITTYGPFETHSEYGPLRAGALRLYDAIATPRIIGGADVVFVRYPALIDWVRSFGKSAKRIHLEPSGIPRDSLTPRSPSRFREKVLGSPIILYLGRISPQKGVQYAVESMAGVVKRFPESKLVMVGPDYIGYSKFLKARAAELGIKESVVVAGPLYDEESQLEAIAACDLFVMPSSFEGFSQAVMKAMAQGKPVVVTRVGGLPYEVNYGECGAMCEYGDSLGLERTLIGLLEDVPSASQLGKRGRNRAGSFTFDALAVNMRDWYASVAG